MTYTDTEVLELVKIHSEDTEQWVKDARNANRTLKALVEGEGFHEELIERIEHLESAERATVRKKYSKDIRDLFDRVLKKRQNVFDANGGSENIKISSEKIKEQLDEALSSFKSNKSLYKYLNEYYFPLVDVDPNGVVMLEYETKEDDFNLYPSYKNINDIRYYSPKGQLVDYILFEPIIHEESGVKSWRFVDDKKDYTITDIGGIFTINEDKTFEHPFGKVPLVILSEKEIVGSMLRKSPIDSVTQLAKDYARDKSVLTIYKFQKGSPLHWRYGSTKCKDCNGLGKKGNNPCTTCDGKGQPRKVDVSDVNYIPIPQEGQPFIGDKIGGFISPDLETWQQYKEDLRDAEILIDDTIWGTDKIHYNEKSNETATGRYIDVQPITITLNSYSNLAEYVYNTFANWVLNFIDQTKDKDKIEYTRSFGRHYIIESPDVLTERYNKSKAAGDNNTILDKQLEEIILSKYKSDPHMQSLMLKKSSVEPYVHLSIKEVYDFYGAVESNKKVLFNKFWKQANKEKTTEQLEEEFNTYFNNFNTIENESSSKEEVIIEE
jgi:hypothetical protein